MCSMRTTIRSVKDDFMSQSNQKMDLGTGSVRKLLLKMAIPTVVAQLINLIVIMIQLIELI